MEVFLAFLKLSLVPLAVHKTGAEGSKVKFAQWMELWTLFRDG